jgi:hypothetical protein
MQDRGDNGPGSGDARQVRVFINYRRDDTSGDARLLHDRLTAAFGADNVFLDVTGLRPGVMWLREILGQARTCAVFLSLIGPRWTPTLRDRAQREDPVASEDYVKLEIEEALRHRRDGLAFIPVLVENAVPPQEGALPRSLAGLAQIQPEFLRSVSYDDDVARLIAAIKQKAAAPAPIQRQGATPGGEPADDEPSDDQQAEPDVPRDVIPAPPDSHYRSVAEYLVRDGSLVVLLGSRLKQHRAGEDTEECVADPEELARKLADRFRGAPVSHDLVEIAQYVSATKGVPDVYKALKEIMTDRCRPGPVHQFLAGLPATLEAAGIQRRFQMIVTSSFDMALENAFDEAGEPYDLAVYMAGAQNRGRFVHFPYDESDPVVIEQPNRYERLPIDEGSDLERTLIVKIHGAVDAKRYGWTQNYLITEDQYIDYLSRSPVESLVPTQVLGKLKTSHCLFLGYAMRDWNLRVFLQRVWPGEQLASESWAIEPGADWLASKLWAKAGVTLYDADLTNYAGRLSEVVAAPLAAA